MIDNVNKLRHFLRFDKDRPVAYCVQIIKRRKENPSMQKGEKQIKVYFLYSIDDFDNLVPYIKEKCVQHNARAYIDLNARDCNYWASQMHCVIAHYHQKGDFKSLPKAHMKAFAQTPIVGTKLWVIDLDRGDESEGQTFEQYVQGVKKEIFSLQKETKKSEHVLQEIPTTNGMHLICSPFNRKKFSDLGFQNLVKEKPKPLTVLYQM